VLARDLLDHRLADLRQAALLRQRGYRQQGNSGKQPAGSAVW
jgi:hypothetical protein